MSINSNSPVGKPRLESLSTSLHGKFWKSVSFQHFFMLSLSISTKHKETKDLYIENYKTLVKEIKEDTNGEIYHVHGSEESI